MQIVFRLNGETVELRDPSPTRTLLDWLREDRGLAGTKEGCNEGDCGACTVMVMDRDGVSPLNACILFLPQLHGKTVRTVEGLAQDGVLHPVQQAMVDHHGSQCGFCTPGFVTTMAAAHLNKATNHDDALAGNLCRCTGYAPIVRAAQAAAQVPPPTWLQAEAAAAADYQASLQSVAEQSNPTSKDQGPFARPASADELAAWYEAHPDATLIAGATDVGLWVTKQLRDLAPVAFLNGCRDLKTIEISDDIRIGSMASVEDARRALAPYHPSLAELLRRFASPQIRAAATVGGNIANGSPIGDSPPALIALGAQLHLRKGTERRTIALEDFFVDYGKQDRQPGEFVEAVTLPRHAPGLCCYKLSKRFDQDISAVCGGFNLAVENGRITGARIAFGGMAGTPKRAHAVEAFLANRAIDDPLHGISDAWEQDFAPMTDMRASAGYRMQTAQNMLVRYLADLAGKRTDLLEVLP